MVKYLHGIKLIESDFGLYLYDAHGNVTGILDSNCDISQSYTYDPFGADIVSAAESEIRDDEMQSLIPSAGIMSSGMIINHVPEHPFYVPQKGWTGAIHLRAGDMLVLSNGEYVVVEKVEHELLESPVKVYNFEVKDFHTY